MRHHQIVAFVLSCVLLATAGVAEAKSRTKYHGFSGTYDGTIVSVSAKRINVDVGKDQPKTTSIQIEDGTTFSVNGKPGTVGDLAKGQKVSVVVKNDKAVSITVTG